jgi:hypothetical protein
MTFEEILDAAHWTPAIFAAIDTEVERQRRIQEDICPRQHEAGAAETSACRSVSNCPLSAASTGRAPSASHNASEPEGAIEPVG